MTPLKSSLDDMQRPNDGASATAVSRVIRNIIKNTYSFSLSITLSIVSASPTRLAPAINIEEEKENTIVKYHCNLVFYILPNNYTTDRQ